jgi:hypothetical protein
MSSTGSACHAPGDVTAASSRHESPQCRVERAASTPNINKPTFYRSSFRDTEPSGRHSVAPLELYRIQFTLPPCLFQIALYPSRDSSAGIATGYEVDGRGSIPGRGKIFLFSTASRPVLGPSQLRILYISGALSLGVRRPGCEADHSI